MIEIDRNQAATPAILDLDDEDSAASKETKKAIAWAMDPDNEPKPQFKVYNRDEVKLALINLFNFKCAYCETSVVSARDIEHFRPKGQIDPDTGEEVIKPGYYWLAANWDNLLLSCPDCNQLRRQIVRGDDGKWVFAEEATGKLDKFPLRDEDGRVTSHLQNIDDEEEHRLLLNPCTDPVRKHVRFDRDGNIIPRQINGNVSDMAEVSIKVFVLYRSTLVEARKAKYLQMVQIMEDIRFVSRVIDIAPASEKELIWARLRQKEDDLLKFTDEKSIFAGMARWLIKPQLREIQKVKEQFETKFGPPPD